MIEPFLDFAVLVAGIWIALWQPKQKKAKYKWIAVFVTLGIASAVVSWQNEQENDARFAELSKGLGSVAENTKQAPVINVPPAQVQFLPTPVAPLAPTAQPSDAAEKRRKLALQGLISRLSALRAQQPALLAACKEMDKADYEAAVVKWASSAVDLLTEAQRVNDATRMRITAPPAGMPRLVAPVCEPHSENVRVAIATSVRGFLLDEIIGTLERN